MAENILLWSSYLMIVAVVFLCMNGIQETSGTRERAITGTITGTRAGKGMARCLFTYILPLAPIILYVLLYLLVAAPQSIEKLSLIELSLFNMMIQSGAAGVGIILFFWVLGIFKLGVRYLHQTIISIKSSSG